MEGRRIADTMISTPWYPPIQEFVLSKNTGFQLLKTEILCKLNIVSYQLVEYSSVRDFIMLEYLCLEYLS